MSIHHIDMASCDTESDCWVHTPLIDSLNEWLIHNCHMIISLSVSVTDIHTESDTERSPDRIHES